MAGRLRVVRAGSDVRAGVEVKLGSEETGGAFSVLELALDPGRSSGFHGHAREDEALVVLSGRMRIEADGDAAEVLEPGDVALLPRGLRHSFANAGDEPVRALAIVAPAGLERFFGDLAAGVEPAEAAERAGLTFG